MAMKCCKGIDTIHDVTHSKVVRWARAPIGRFAKSSRVLNVPPDVFDLRDRKYAPRLAPLPRRIDPRRHDYTVPIRDQGDEGACTGFAMAAVVNHLRARLGELFEASPRFLYENAKRHDEWRGQEYEGSSIRGAMKGFLRHGVCSWKALPYEPGRAFDRLPDAALKDAGASPLGAYFRVSTSSINDVQNAIAEVGVVLASAQVHRGWDEPAARGKDLPAIAWNPRSEQQGGHAFVLVGYDERGFVVQNSWGVAWGAKGLAHLSYEDWLANRMDAWVCQLGIGHVLQPARTRATATAARADVRVKDEEIRGHYVAIRNGRWDTSAPYPSGPGDVVEIAARVVEFAKKHGTKKNPAPVMLYAHGGLVDEHQAAGKVRHFKERFLPSGIYPIHFIWHSGFRENVGDLLLGRERDVAKSEGEERTRGALKDKLTEAKDEVLELLLRPLGRPLWREMKRDAREACQGAGDPNVKPAYDLVEAIAARAAAAGASISWHLVGHSAGSILHSFLVEWFRVKQVPVASCSFLAPAVTCGFFRETVMHKDLKLGRFGLHTMPDADERDDDCAGVYRKSLLYLVSQSFEEHDERQLVGLARHVDLDWRGRDREVDSAVKQWLQARKAFVWRRPRRTDGSLHGAFDDDEETLAQVEARIK